jgi:hypothetical protein
VRIFNLFVLGLFWWIYDQIVISLVGTREMRRILKGEPCKAKIQEANGFSATNKFTES